MSTKGSMAISLYAVWMQKSSQEKELRKRVLNSIDYERVKQGYPLCFKNKESFYQTELPDLSHLPQSLKQQALEGIEDKDMKQDLLAADLINWCSNTRHVLPLLVPRDGNCLLHSVSMAIWGFLDDCFVLRRLLCLVLSTDKDSRFYSRWIRQRQQQISTLVDPLLVSNAESLMKEWREIAACLDRDKSASVAVPHRFLEPIHVYALANILRRPIIVVTDSTVRTFVGFSLQDNDMGGIYLPLEFNWSETCRTPVLLGYMHSHFCPLILADPSTRLTHSRIEKKHLIPIVTKFEQLPVRFLLEGEEPEAGELLKKYLRVRETVVTLGQEFREILCADMQSEAGHSEYSLMKEYFRLWEDQYRLQQRHFKPMPEEGLFPSQVYVQLPSQQTQGPTRPEYHSQQPLEGMSPSGTPAGGLLRASVQPQTGLRQLQRATTASSPNIVVEVPGAGGFPWVSSSVQSQGSLPLQRQWGQLEENSLSSLGARRCVTPGCKFCGDPALGMMCSVCFKNYTIKDSQRNAARLVLAEQRQHPTAPFQSGIADEERFETSMMTERCHGRCGYRCSSKTYPYCHECAETFRRQAQAKASAEAQAGSISGTASAQGMTLSGAQEPVIPLAINIVTSELIAAAVSSGSSSCLAAVPAESIQNQACMSPVNIRTHEFAATGGNLCSPSEALASVNLVAPLTPPDDNDQDLFGSGVKSLGLSDHVGSPVPTLTAALQQKQTQQASPASHSEQLEDNRSEPIPVVRNPPSLVTARKTTNEPEAKCARMGCTEAVVLNNLCGKCFVSSPEGKQDDSGTSKRQEPIVGSSSIPAALEAGQGTSAPGLGHSQGQKQEARLSLENRSHLSSLSNQPPRVEPPLNADPEYVAEWLAGVNMGLPDRHGSELGEQDLIASGLACHSSTHPCAGPRCSNRVIKANQLCKECTDILSKARRRPEPIEEAVAGQPQRSQSSHTVVVPSNSHTPSIMPQSPRPATVPMGRRGQHCVVSGCELFGDPSQNNMCSKHFWSRAQPSRSSPVAGVNLLTTSAAAGSLGGGAHFAMPESMGSACYMQGSISVPPPSFPVAESEAGSGHGDFAGLQANVKLAEVYKRLMPWPEGVPKCSVVGCSNYASKKGMCNSCYNNSLSLEEARRYVLLGEEQIG